MAFSFSDLVSKSPLGWVLNGPKTTAEDAAAQAALDASINAYNIDLPELQQYNPEVAQYLGDYKPVSNITAPTISAGQDLSYQQVDPRFADVQQMGSSSFNDIAIDPRFENQQIAALDSLTNIANSGGLTAADQANLNKIQTDVAAADRGRREAIMQNMQSRGMAGSGNELLAKLQSSQAATDRANQAGLDVAGMAQQRALDALMQSGTLSGNMQNQKFSQEAQKAAARDAIAQFNAANMNQASLSNANIANQMGMQNAANQYMASQANRDAQIAAQSANAANNMSAQQFNASAANQAGQINQAARQNQANQAADTRNQGQLYNIGLGQQQFDNKATLAAGKSGAQQGAQAFYQNQADRKVKKDAAMKEALIKGGTAIYTAGMK
jgi:hypothetical protein